MKIGVITLPFSPNYGWLLQAYALQQTLIKNGHDAILISRRWNIVEKNNSLFMKIMRPFYYNVNCGRIYRFYKKHIKTTKVYRDSDALRTVIQEYKLDAVIVGSDQVWRIEDICLTFAACNHPNQLSSYIHPKTNAYETKTLHPTLPSGRHAAGPTVSGPR